MKKTIQILTFIFGIVFVAGIAILTQSVLATGIGLATIAAFSKTCTDRSGGIKTLWLADIASVDSFTLASGSTTTYDTITMTSGALFYAIEFEQDLGEFRETVSRENNSTIVEQEIEFFLPVLNETSRTAVQNMLDSSGCGFIAVVQDVNDTKWVVGYSPTFLKTRPCRVISDASSTGKALNDPTGATVVIGCKSKTKALVTTATPATS